MTARSSCCDKQDWQGVRDLGHAKGFDFDLGRCRNCGADLMAIGYADRPTVHVIGRDEAQRFRSLEGAELAKALRNWAGE